MSREQLIDKYTQYKQTLENVVNSQQKLDALCNTYKEKEKEEASIRKGSSASGCLACILPFILFLGGVNFFVVIILGGLSYFLLEFYRKSKHQTEYDAEANKFHFEVLEPLKTEIQSQKDYIDKLWDNWDMKALSEDLPEDYCSLDAIDFFLKALKNRRADTEKEAFNLYEAHLKEEAFINLQKETLNTQQEQLKATQEIQKNTEEQKEILKDVQYTQKQTQRTQKKISKRLKYGNAVDTLDFLFKK